MGFLKDLKGWLGIPRPCGVSPPMGRTNPLFVYVRLPAHIEPLDRGARFEDPLQESLERAGLGEITGGGSQLSDPDEEGRRRIVFCGIDIDIYEPVEGLALLRRELARLQAPRGTALLYEMDGQEFEQPVYDD
ncbi:MAG: hypothetical protein AB1714_17440 [Acidobacteriota bacterium]